MYWSIGEIVLCFEKVWVDWLLVFSVYVYMCILELMFSMDDESLKLNSMIWSDLGGRKLWFWKMSKFYV